MKIKKSKKAKSSEKSKYLKTAKEEGISTSWAKKAYTLKELLRNS